MNSPAALPHLPPTVRRNDLTIVSGYEDLLAAQGADSLDALFSIADAEVLSKPGLAGWRERLRVTWTVNGQSRTFYLKRFSRPPRSTRRDIRRSRTDAKSLAGVEWNWMCRLARDGIACTRPVAIGEQVYAGREVRSVLLTEAVGGDALERWALRWNESDRPDRTIVRSLLEHLAELVARFHSLGYVHRDLYLSHVFYDPDSPVEQSLRLIDLQRVFRPRLQQRWIVKDLAALHFSAPASLATRSDRLRWLTRYLGLAKLDRSAKRLIHRVLTKARRISRHEGRRLARRRIGSRNR